MVGKEIHLTRGAGEGEGQSRGSAPSPVPISRDCPREADRIWKRGRRSTPSEDHLQRMIKLQEKVEDGYKAGLRKAADVASARYFRAEAEVLAAQAKGG